MPSKPEWVGMRVDKTTSQQQYSVACSSPTHGLSAAAKVTPEVPMGESESSNPGRPYTWRPTR